VATVAFPSSSYDARMLSPHYLRNSFLGVNVYEDPVACGSVGVTVVTGATLITGASVLVAIISTPKPKSSSVTTMKRPLDAGAIYSAAEVPTLLPTEGWAKLSTRLHDDVPSSLALMTMKRQVLRGSLLHTLFCYALSLGSTHSSIPVPQANTTPSAPPALSKVV